MNQWTIMNHNELRYTEPYTKPYWFIRRDCYGGERRWSSRTIAWLWRVCSRIRQHIKPPNTSGGRRYCILFYFTNTRFSLFYPVFRVFPRFSSIALNISPDFSRLSSMPSIFSSIFLKTFIFSRFPPIFQQGDRAFWRSRRETSQPRNYTEPYNEPYWFIMNHNEP